MPLTPREERGLRIVRQPGHVAPRQSDRKDWNVRSESRSHDYIVSVDPPDSPRCTCPDFELRRQSCKHIIAVEYAIGRRAVPEETTAVRKTYSQDWPAYNAAKTREWPLFVKLLHDLCQAVKEPQQRMGRRRLPFADMVFAAVCKAYVGFSSRRANGFLEDACIREMIGKVPHFNSVLNYLAKPELTSVLEQLVTLSSLPLRCVEKDFAPDSSGFSTCQFLRWYNQKYGRETDNRKWVKAHILCGVKTHVVASALVSEWSANDSPYLKPLVARAAGHFDIREVLADKAYLSRDNVETIAALDAMPFIPFKTNTVEPRPDGSVWNRMHGLWMLDREAFLKRYHQRSNAETTFSMIKRNFGDSVRSKTFPAQANEVLCKVLCHNISVLVQEMFELGIRPDFLEELERGEMVIGGGSSQPEGKLAG